MYLVFNEFQSVIAQRVVVERILPIKEIGKQDIASAFEMDQEEREEMGKAAQTAGVSVRTEDTREADEEAKKFGTAEVDYIYEQPPARIAAALLPQIHIHAALPRAAGVGGRRNTPRA